MQFQDIWYYRFDILNVVMDIIFVFMKLLPFHDTSSLVTQYRTVLCTSAEVVVV